MFDYFRSILILQETSVSIPRSHASILIKLINGFNKYLISVSRLNYYSKNWGTRIHRKKQFLHSNGSRQMTSKHKFNIEYRVYLMLIKILGKNTAV